MKLHFFIKKFDFKRFLEWKHTTGAEDQKVSVEDKFYNVSSNLVKTGKNLKKAEKSGHL